jgi:PPP family 3-phenylpropionic acid transporter
MEEQDAIKGQAYMTMTYTLGSVLGALIGGSLIDLAGVNAMLIFATISSGIGMLIVLLAAQRPKQISEDRTAA